jgi:streptogramin lyase
MDRGAFLRGLAGVVGSAALTAEPEMAEAAGGGSPLLAPSRFGAPEDRGKPIKSVVMLSCVVTQENDRPVVIGIANGNVPVLNVVDIRDNRLLRSFRLPKGSGGCFGGTVVPDGTAYLQCSRRLIRYDPRRRTMEDLGAPDAAEGAFWHADHDADGNVYTGSYPHGRVYRYDPRARKYDLLGDVGQSYARSTAYHRNTVYTGTGPVPHGKLFAFDVRTKARREIPLPEMAAGLPTWVYSLEVRGDRYLFAFLSGFPDNSTTLQVYDLTEQRWRPRGFPGYGDLYIGPERGGKTYFRWNRHWHEYDLATGGTRELPAVADNGSHRGGGWADLKDGKGPVIAAASFAGTILLTDPATGAQRILPSVMESEGNDLQAMAVGRGSRLYLSGFQSGQGASVETTTGKIDSFPMGQAEGIVSHGDKVWFGVYAGAHIFEMDTTKPLESRRNPREIYVIPDHQDRPFAMAASGDWLVAGTIPDYGQLGGSLAVQDRRTGAWTSYRNVVPRQSVVSTVLRGDTVYASTSILGGLGSRPNTPEAKIFSWDLRTGRKLKETGLMVPGKKAPRFIGGLAFGPDGLLWGVADGTVFALDPATLAVRRLRTIYGDVEGFGRFRPQFVGFGPDGLLYANPAGRVTAIDPATLEFRPLGIQTELMILGNDGSLYYRGEDAPARLMRIAVRPLTGASGRRPGRE